MGWRPLLPHRGCTPSSRHKGYKPCELRKDRIPFWPRSDCRHFLPRRDDTLFWHRTVLQRRMGCRREFPRRGAEPRNPSPYQRRGRGCKVCLRCRGCLRRRDYRLSRLHMDYTPFLRHKGCCHSWRHMAQADRPRQPAGSAARVYRHLPSPYLRQRQCQLP